MSTSHTSGPSLTAEDLLALRQSGVSFSADARAFLGLSPDDLLAATGISNGAAGEEPPPADGDAPTQPPTPVEVSANGAPLGKRPPLRREVLYTTLVPFARRGASAKLAAELLAQPYSTVLAIYNDPAFRSEVHSLMRSAFGTADAAYIDSRVSLAQQIESAGQLAFNTLCSIIGDPDAPAAVRVTAARDILDRNRSTRAGTSTSVDVSFTSIDAAKLVEAATAARALDATPLPTVVPIDRRIA